MNLLILLAEYNKLNKFWLHIKVYNFLLFVRTAFTAKTIQKLYDEGTRQERLEKDEEMAYIFYMRFLTAVQCVKSIPILKDEFKARVSIAISQSEELSESLKKRYEVAKDCQVAERRVKELELLDATKNITKRNGSLSNGFTPAYPTAVEEEVTADELKTLMDKRATRFLLMDTRSPADFASSHPKHPDSISISNVILAQGSVDYSIRITITSFQLILGGDY